MGWDKNMTHPEEELEDLPKVEFPKGSGIMRYQVDEAPIPCRA